MTAELLRSLPKVQLHCHLEGTLRPSTFLDLARKHEVALTYEPDGSEAPSHQLSVTDPYSFRDFRGFVMVFAAVSRSLASPEDFQRLAAEYAEEMLAQNVQRAELFISPSVWQYFYADIDVRACIEAIHAGFDGVQKRGCSVALIVDVTRNFGAESAMRTARLAATLQDLGVIGIGLGGDEAQYPCEQFAETFAWARSQGLHRVAHAGELAGAQSVRNTVELLDAERIGHGVRALEEPSVVRFLAQKRVPLEVCPTSNFLMGIVMGEAPHPLVELDAAGCIVTIDADDPAFFKTSITSEYEYVAEIAGVDAVLRFARNAIDASFAPPDEKKVLHGRLTERWEA